jgi:glycosyltransferase involved in cell wall biosynthesis
MPIFSIIVPIYKVEAYLRICLDSVLAQTFTDYECILVDDGSPDNCPAICDEYAAKDIRFKVIHKENGGLSDARNTGILAAAGEWIVLLDSDDLFAADDALENLHGLTEKAESGVICNGNLRMLLQNGKISDCDGFQKDIQSVDSMELRSRFYGLCLTAWMFAVKRNLIVHNNLFFLNVLHEDMHWVPLLLFYSNNIGINHHSYYAYRTNRENSITNKPDVRNVTGLIQIIEELMIFEAQNKTQRNSNIIKAAYVNIWITTLNLILSGNITCSKHKRKYFLRKMKKLLIVFRRRGKVIDIFFYWFVKAGGLRFGRFLLYVYNLQKMRHLKNKEIDNK